MGQMQMKFDSNKDESTENQNHSAYQTTTNSHMVHNATLLNELR